MELMYQSWFVLPERTTSLQIVALIDVAIHFNRPDLILETDVDGPKHNLNEQWDYARTWMRTTTRGISSSITRHAHTLWTSLPNSVRSRLTAACSHLGQPPEWVRTRSQNGSGARFGSTDIREGPEESWYGEPMRRTAYCDCVN